ncbi:MAG: hypothetical protein Q8927_04885 [Bacteroidota bacterium]|nr:hypothetical protein [Bacteroidota bacterium]MDP4247161.1 hypothetical protein [Bacteroidota bacterium]MDP4253077.1 hypothetical protein [Bacteroidota bacterium]MDP4259818.1 hypothetical protein [Bacteroidota bacterium]
MWRALSLVTGMLLFVAGSLPAQRVLYCSPPEDRFVQRREVAGMAGDHFIVRVDRRRRGGKHRDGSNEESWFEVFDSRMERLNSVPAMPLTDSVVKEYLISGADHFDQLLLLRRDMRTGLVVRRYEPTGEVAGGGEKEVGSLSFPEGGNSFLLIRSADRSKVLLLGFEPVPSSPPKLHALLFDQDWRMLYYRVFDHPYLTQPLIQDDLIAYPIEDYDNSPVKLADNGQWLMISPSRTNQNYLLFHFCETENCLSYKEISLPPGGSPEDLALSLDNEGQEAFVGVLSRLHYTTLKQVRVAHYSLSRQALDFDSSYRFNTLPAAKIRNANLYKESFTPVPGKGFLLLKEYGRPFTGWVDDPIDDSRWDPAVLFADNPAPASQAGAAVIRDGYARYSMLGGPNSERERGDLSFYYLPGMRGDSCWSGMLNKRQTTEMNSPSLSYLVLAIRDKLIFLYNSLFADDDEYGSATVMDSRGNLLADGGPLFWKFKITLDFQQARRISEREIAIPYAGPRRNGFAIIRF